MRFHRVKRKSRDEKTLLLLLIATLLLTALAGCGKTKPQHGDHGQKEITVEEDSNMEEEWIIYCPACNEELFGDDPLLSGK